MAERHEITTKKVLYQIPGMDSVKVQLDVPYKETDAGALTLDIYYPPDSKPEGRNPAVVFVIGFSDIGAQAMLGCRFKEMESYISWAKLAAVSGLTAITYSTGKDPAADVQALLQYIRENAASLGIDKDRIGIWSCSGNVPNALSVLIKDSDIKFAALCYGYTLDLEGATHVADASQKMRFVNPCVGKSIDDLPHNTPLFLLRAGRDETPGLNDALDRFIKAALARNLPMNLFNHPEGTHAFDLTENSEACREAIRNVLGFLRSQLLREQLN
jgi:dienelactone hydrolase